MASRPASRPTHARTITVVCRRKGFNGENRRRASNLQGSNMSLVKPDTRCCGFARRPCVEDAMKDAQFGTARRGQATSSHGRRASREKEDAEEGTVAV